LGVFSPSNGFEKFAWLPTMNSAVFTTEVLSGDGPEIGEREFNLANIPGTSVAVVAKIDDLVDYHTAILGVTGTGKTELALGIVKETLNAGVKVFCVDFTGQYRERLNSFASASPGPTKEEIAALDEKLRAVDYGSYGAGPQKQALDEAIRDLRDATQEQVSKFMEGVDPLALFELPGITNNKATLRVTELYLSSIMEWARKNPQKQRVLIVLEEAHTIIPETGGAGFDFDTQWVVGRIGQIALQGRKLQVGLLVVCQRTALVSKTILSQCNTFFTHTLIDQTSLSFLDSVYSHQHARLIPNLGRYEFIAYGKGIKAARPVILTRSLQSVS
jgi:DNA helicase HerA-like ATPase